MANPTATTLSERVKGYVDQRLLPTISDNIFSGNVLLFRLFNNPKPWSGGVQMQRSVLWQKSSQGGSFSGADVFDTASEDNTIRLAFDPKGVYQPVVILGTEKALNEGDAGKIRLVTNKMEEAKLRLADRLGVMMYGDGTGNSSKDFNGLGNIVDDGTTAATYGGQTRSSYGSTLNATRSASVTTLTLDHMATQVDAATGTGGQRTEPTLIVTTKTVRSLYESLLTPTVRHNLDSFGPMMLYSSGPMRKATEPGANQGFSALAFRGIPVVADDQATSGNMYFLNEHELDFHAINDPELQSMNKTNPTTIEGSVYNNTPALSAVQWRDFMKKDDQYAMTGQFIIQGQLVSWNPRRHAISTGITTA